MKRVRAERRAEPDLRVTITLAGYRSRGPVYDGTITDGDRVLGVVERQRSPFCAAARVVAALGEYSPLTPIRMFRPGVDEPALVGRVGPVSRVTVMENDYGISLVRYQARDFGGGDDDDGETKT